MLKRVQIMINDDLLKRLDTLIKPGKNRSRIVRDLIEKHLEKGGQ